jgi:hypothetical protein
VPKLVVIFLSRRPLRSSFPLAICHLLIFPLRVHFSVDLHRFAASRVSVLVSVSWIQGASFSLSVSSARPCWPSFFVAFHFGTGKGLDFPSARVFSRAA